MKKKGWFFIGLLGVFLLIVIFGNKEEKQREEFVANDMNENVIEAVDIEDTDIAEETEETFVEEAEDTDTEEQAEATTIEVVKKGRGNSDNGRSEPFYNEGYVALSTSDMVNEYETFPASPWFVHAVEQSGPDVDDLKETDVKIPHKTKVKVLEQHLTHKRYGNYDGWLLVQTVEEPVQTYKIDVHNFVTYAYWNRDAYGAAEMGPSIAVYNGKGEKPYKDDEFVDVEVGTEVYLSGIEYGGKVEAFVYREWRLGYGGVEVVFDPESLDIKY